MKKNCNRSYKKHEQDLAIFANISAMSARRKKSAKEQRKSFFGRVKDE